MNKNVISRRSALAAAGAVVAGLGLSACSGGEPVKQGSVADGGAGSAYKVGVLQLTEHAALDAVNKGFVKALDDSGISYEIDQQNAQNDQSACQTIASKLVGDGDDLIFAIGTPAAQAVAGATADIPVVASAITDFAASGLVADNDAPGGNVTGTSDLTPVSDQLDLMIELLPSVEHVGILYCTSEANSVIQAELAEAKLSELGVGYERFTVSSSNEIQTVVESMVGKVDAIYTPTDNTVAAGMAQVAQIALENKTPTICGEKAHVEAGGLFSLSIDYEELGYRAGEMAVRILTEGAEPKDMPIEHLDAADLELVKNEDTAAAIGVDLSVLGA